MTVQRLGASWGSRSFSYDLIRENRRDLVITVFPDCRVEVRAPASRPLERVTTRVHARRSWIARQLKTFEDCAPMPPHRFAQAESCWYLGRQYRLRIERTGRGVAIRSGRLVVRVSRGAGTAAVRSAVLAWYGQRARAVFLRRMAQLQSATAMLTKLDVQLRVRRMKRRWGSCTAQGTITINPELLQAPASCIDYVLVHEMLHLIEPHHSPRFYRLLSRAMPDWEQRRSRLAKAAHRSWSHS